MIIYDCEIKNVIPNKKEQQKRGLKYCKGWTDYKGMGISCIGVYDVLKDNYRIFCDDNMEAFQKLIDQRDSLVGFNNKNFDDNLCRAHGLILDEKKSYDLMVEIKIADGLKPNAIVKGYSLDNIAKVNGIQTKTESGAMAPVMWQRKQIGRVIDYCLLDVFITKEIFLLAYEGKIKSLKTGRYLKLRMPRI
jgi:hypothetical protein